ncbi:hypothetical protein CHCC20335_0286 [Bacillus paralicheniformis]|nr:hypothetical protein CHCC20335_0286 [Bacillus paralicheniformis]
MHIKLDSIYGIKKSGTAVGFKGSSSLYLQKEEKETTGFFILYRGSE